MNRQRQRALVTIVQTEDIPLKILISSTKPDCIILLICTTLEQDHLTTVHISSLLDKTQQACNEHGLTGISIMAIEGPSRSQSLLTVSQYFQGLFSSLTSKGFDLILDITQADKKWMIPLYVAALRQRPCVDSILMVDDAKILEFWVYVDLTTAERTILEYLLEMHPATLTPSEITDQYIRDHGQGSGSFISKLLRSLKEAKLIQEHKKGRYKFIKLSEHGLALFCPSELRKTIQNQLRVPRPKTTSTSTLISSIQQRLDESNMTSLDEWLSFRRSTYFSIHDFHVAQQLGFELHEGLAFYVHQIVSKLLSTTEDLSLESIDKMLTSKLQAISNQDASRKDLIFHPSHATFLKSSKEKRLKFLTRVLNADPRIKQLFSENHDLKRE